MNNRALVKIWNNKLQKWYYTFVDIKNDEDASIISYKELLNKAKKIKIR